MRIKKRKINFIIDALMLISLAFTSGVGFLLKYAESIIIKMGLHKIGATLTFLGLKIQQWGDIHFIASIVFLTLLLIHIIIHLKWTASVYRNIIKDKPAAYIAACLFIIIIILLLIFPFIIKPAIKERPSQVKHTSGYDTITVGDRHACPLQKRT